MEPAGRIIEAIQHARSRKCRLDIRGHGSKRAWLPDPGGEVLEMSELTGIVAYDPAELVVTARAGTGIKEVVSELAHAGQELAFEPPQFFGEGTMGGMVSSGLSGPARPWGGSTRDAVLGVTMVNGLGEPLKFGGQVMKNVAGYDVSRLMTGAWGVLGAVLQVSLRVQPKPDHVVTLGFELDAQAANDRCRELAREYLPVNGTWWRDGQLYLRLSGSEAGVVEACSVIGGTTISPGQLWSEIRDHTNDFFRTAGWAGESRELCKLWRVIVPPAAPMPEVASSRLAVEWGGGLRWIWHEDDAFVRDYALRQHGWAWALGGSVPLHPAQRQIMRAIKNAFDPDDVFAGMLDPGAAHAD